MMFNLDHVRERRQLAVGFVDGPRMAESTKNRRWHKHASVSISMALSDDNEAAKIVRVTGAFASRPEHKSLFPMSKAGIQGEKLHKHHHYGSTAAVRAAR